MTYPKEYKKLLTYTKTTTTYESIFRLLSWDQETMMPKGAYDVRASQMALMAADIHKRKTSASYKRLLASLIDLQSGHHKIELPPLEKAAVRELRKDYLQAVKLPTKFVHTMSEISAQAMNAWTTARENNDFSIFQPKLEKIIELTRKKAKILGFSDHPYDALINVHEPGMTTKQLKTLFSRLKERLINLLNEIKAKDPIDDTLCHGPFDKDKQRALGEVLANLLRINPKHSRIDESTHPFSIGIHPLDARFTTRIEESFLSNLLSILHEAGHSFYEIGLNPDYFGTPVAEAVSLGIHESQSRWWETRIGRSLSFWRYFYPYIQKAFPEFIKIPLEEFYRMINVVKPSFIRVNADEVTYCLHIILRFEIELLLVEGKLKVKDLPTKWNDLFEEMFGIRPENDRLGVLQDVHWSMGELGYFPTYALGNIYASHFFEAFEKEHPDYEAKIEKGELEFIRLWLKNKIHTHGRVYSPEELAERVTGKKISEEAFVTYLEKKYRKIYQ